MKKMSNVCDYFVIASGASTTQVRAIADHICEIMRSKGERTWHKEGEREASWLLLDYGDVVAHVFLEPTRKFYDLERLWGDAPQSRFEEVKPARKSARKAKKVTRKPKKIVRRSRLKSKTKKKKHRR